MIFFPKPGDCDLDPSVFQHPECTDVMDFFERRIDNITSTSLYFHEMASTNSMFCQVVVFRCSFQDVSDYRQRALGLIARHLPPYFRTKRRSDADGTCGILSGGNLQVTGFSTAKFAQLNTQGILCKAFWEHLQNRRSCDSGSNRCGTTSW